MFHIISWSGGKDSTAMLHFLLKKIEQPKIIYIDVEIVVPESREYVYQIAQEWNLDVIILRPEKDFFAVLKEKGFLPTPKKLWCLHELKLKPFYRWMKTLPPEKIKTVYVGIRKAESRYRNAHYQDEIIVKSRKHKIIYVYPVLRWSNEDVDHYFDVHNIPKNPAYARYGYSSCRHEYCPYYATRPYNSR